MYEWNIVGGGLHGCTIATYLIKNKITTIEKIKVIDPHREPLVGWKKRTSLIGMEFLRFKASIVILFKLFLRS